MRRGTGVHEIDALVRESPVPPISSLGEFHDERFNTAIHGNTPESSDVLAFGVVHESVRHVTQGRRTLRASSPAPPIRLRHWSSRPPNARCDSKRSRSIAHRLDQLGTTSSDGFGCHAARRPTLQRHVDIGVLPYPGVERHVAAVRSPPRRAGEVPANETSIGGGCARPHRTPRFPCCPSGPSETRSFFRPARSAGRRRAASKR